MGQGSVQSWMQVVKDGLASYNFNLKYRSGKMNTDADALSRIDWKEISESGVKSILSGIDFEPIINGRISQILNVVIRDYYDYY